MMNRRRVVITERRLAHYRVSFFERLRAILAADDIDLQVLYSQTTAREALKKDIGTLDWGIEIPATYFIGDRLCWQPYADYAKAADLVIVNHENKILYNLWLMFIRRPHRLAFWGHGRNMQSDKPGGLKEKFKHWTINKVDWWFAYTASSAELVCHAGFPRERITSVENAIDTCEMAALCADTKPGVWNGFRESLRIGDGPVALFLGSLYSDKRLDFLIDAAIAIRERIQNFELLVAGAGDEQHKIEAAAAQYSWIHYLGPVYGARKALVLVNADVLLNPGLVGLGILDSFVAGTPMFTTDCGVHSPEISYLDSGYNGVLTENSLEDYVLAVTGALSNQNLLAHLSTGAKASASRYTVENMAAKFRQGVLACLSAQKYPP